MTASSFASLLKARRCGRGRFTAKCPAHSDSRASLSISEGRNGSVVLHCFAGCETTAVVAAAGLQMRDLFPETRCDSQTIREAQKAAAKRELLDRRKHKDAMHTAHVYRVTLDQIEMLGRKLARHPEDDVLTRKFHAALDRQREMEMRNGWA